MKLKKTTEIKYYLYGTKNYNSIKQRQKSKYCSRRYSWINLHSLFHRGTLEIRSHSGTLNPTKIKNWLKIHLRVLSLIKNLNVDIINNLPDNETFFLSIFDDDLKKYIKSRWKEFENKLQEEVN